MSHPTIMAISKPGCPRLVNRSDPQIATNLHSHKSLDSLHPDLVPTQNQIVGPAATRPLIAGHAVSEPRILRRAAGAQPQIRKSLAGQAASWPAPVISRTLDFRYLAQHHVLVRAGPVIMIAHGLNSA